MKRLEQITHLQKLSLNDLKQHLVELEKKIQDHKMALAFGKTKEVRTLRNLKREVARTLTIAGQKLQTVTQTETPTVAKTGEDN